MTTTSISPAWFNESLKRIVAGVDSITKSVAEISSIYVQAIDRDRAFQQYIAEELPSIPANFWRNLERVGRGQLDGRILSGGVPYGNKLRTLSIIEQSQAIDGPLTLLVRNGDSLLVKIDAITPDQAEQVFARDHIRSLHEQRAWMESRATIKRMRSDTTAPVVELDRKRKEIVIGNVRITASEMAEYLRKLME